MVYKYRISVIVNAAICISLIFMNKMFVSRANTGKIENIKFQKKYSQKVNEAAKYGYSNIIDFINKNNGAEIIRFKDNGDDNSIISVKVRFTGGVKEFNNFFENIKNQKNLIDISGISILNIDGKSESVLKAKFINNINQN